MIFLSHTLIAYPTNLQYIILSDFLFSSQPVSTLQQCDSLERVGVGEGGVGEDGVGEGGVGEGGVVRYSPTFLRSPSHTSTITCST